MTTVANVVAKRYMCFCTNNLFTDRQNILLDKSLVPKLVDFGLSAPSPQFVGSYPNRMLVQFLWK